jgi:hypothetical protein
MRGSYASTPVCGATGTTTPMASLSAGPWCAPQAVPSALGAPVGMAGAVRGYARSSEGTCLDIGNLVAPDLRAVGDPVDLGMFVPGTEGMD